MFTLLETIQELALLFGKSQGWQPFDHQLELDLYLPWSFQDKLRQDFTNQANLFISTNQVSATDEEIRTMLQDPKEPLIFSKFKMPHGILINIVKSHDRFGFELTKKEVPKVTAGNGLAVVGVENDTYTDNGGARVIPMFADEHGPNPYLRA